MDALLPSLALAVGLVAVLGGLVWPALRMRRRGLTGGAMGAALASYAKAFRATGPGTE